jgi:hypothetical protein
MIGFLFSFNYFSFEHRSARNAEVLIAAAKKKGVELPKEERFDSNCITPGNLSIVSFINKHIFYRDRIYGTTTCTFAVLCSNEN